MSITALPTSLKTYMTDFAAIRLRQRIVRRIGLGLLAWLLVAIGCCLVDRFFALSSTTRLFLLIVACFVPVPIIAPSVRRWLMGAADLYDVAKSIERRDRRFSERLVTVTSRLLDDHHDSGSRAMLDHLSAELAEEVASRSPRELIPARRMAAPWIALGIAILLSSLLWLIPLLDMPTLARRFVMPLSDTRPATTTRLHVAPEDSDLVEGQPLQVKVRCERLGDAPVVLHVRRPGRDWLAITLSPDADGTYTSSLGQIDDDMEYFVTGGDATSDRFHIRVLRKPVATQFEIRYDYPAYTALSPATINNSDGTISAPANTRATVRVHSSEPLAAATLTAGGQSLAMKATDDPTVRETTLAITKDEPYELGMSSTRGMVGAGPAHASIHVIPDQPPVARLLLPTGDPFLGSADLLPMRYDASDDFALSSLEVHVRINPFGEPNHNQPDSVGNYRASKDLTVRIAGDPRRQVGEFQLDLSALDLSRGDVASLRLRAEDRGGQSGLSDPVVVMVSPQSISPRDRALDQTLSRATEIAQKSPSIWEPETLDTLKTLLLKAAWQSEDPRTTDLVSLVADALEQFSIPVGSASADRLPQPAWLNALSTLTTAHHARILLRDLNNLNFFHKTLPTGTALPIQQAHRRIARLDADVQSRLAQLHLDPHAPDLSERLKALVTAAESLDHSPIDYANAAQTWFDELQKGRRHSVFVDRLESAAHIETVSVDSDLLWARDLQRSALAAANIESIGIGHALPPAAGRFPTVLSLLQRQHQLRPSDSASAQNESDEVLSARQQMTEWANALPSSSQTPARQLEALTLHASAEAVLRNFSNTLAIDRALAGEVTAAAGRSARSLFASAEAARQMDLVQALDALVLQEDDLVRETEQVASTSSAVGSLADRQKRLSDTLSDTAERGAAPGEASRLDAARQLVALDATLASISNPGDEKLDQQLERIRQTIDLVKPFPEAQSLIQRLKLEVLPIASSLVASGEEQTGIDLDAFTKTLNQTRPMLLTAAEAIVRPDPLAGAQFHAQRAAELLGAQNVEFGPTLREASAALANLRAALEKATRRAAWARAVRIPAIAKAVWEDPSKDQPPTAEQRGAIPRGFDDAINAYFDAIGAAKSPRVEPDE